MRAGKNYASFKLPVSRAAGGLRMSVVCAAANNIDYRPLLLSRLAASCTQARTARRCTERARCKTSHAAPPAAPGTHVALKSFLIFLAPSDADALIWYAASMILSCSPCAIPFSFRIFARSTVDPCECTWE